MAAYDTGDRGMLMPDGSLEALGRYESNVKVHEARQVRRWCDATCA